MLKPIPNDSRTGPLCDQVGQKSNPGGMKFVSNMKQANMQGWLGAKFLNLNFWAFLGGFPYCSPHFGADQPVVLSL